MRRIDVERVTRDVTARFEFLQEYVGFGAEDWRALGESVAVLAPKLPALLDALYDHLLSFDDTRRIFLGPRGEVDPTYMAIRKEHLTEWVLRTVGGEDRAGFARYLAAVGRRHTTVEGEPKRVVPPRYMVGLTGFLQAALWGALFDALPDRPADVRRMGSAWSKMITIQLEIFLKQLAPAWPAWDEG